MPTDPAHSPLRAGLPVAIAIGVFGVIYGALATAEMSPSLTVASSLLVFSGAAQFAVVGLLEVGASTTAIIVAVAVLGLRHVPLAAVVLPRLDLPRTTRAALALGLLDETVGLALATPRRPAATMAVTGGLAYVAFGLGTTAGVLGADLVALEPLASSVFLLLFTGLAALTARGRRDLALAVVSAVATIGLVTVVPAAGALGAIGTALVVAALAGPRAGSIEPVDPDDPDDPGAPCGASPTPRSCDRGNRVDVA